jgi:hypothetical protein
MIIANKYYYNTCRLSIYFLKFKMNEIVVEIKNNLTILSNHVSFNSKQKEFFKWGSGVLS